MPVKLSGHYYRERKLLVIDGGKFTLTVRRVLPGSRAAVLYRFGLRTNGGWKDNGNGIARASITTKNKAA